MKILKLGTMITDTVTNMEGMLIALALDMDQNIHYLFQPAGLSPETKEPIGQFYITTSRAGNCPTVEVDLPVSVLGTEVEDKASGYKGTAFGLYYYLNGCIHFDVKAPGTIEKTGESIKPREFDIRRLKGAAIVEMTETELEQDKKDRPSPEMRPELRTN